MYCMSYLAQKVVCDYAPEPMKSEIMSHMINYIVERSDPPEWLGPDGIKRLIIDNIAFSASLPFDHDKRAPFFQAWAKIFYDIVPAPGVPQAQDRYAEAILLHYDALISEHEAAIEIVKKDPGRNWLSYAHGPGANVAKNLGCSALISVTSVLLTTAIIVGSA